LKDKDDDFWKGWKEGDVVVLLKTWTDGIGWRGGRINCREDMSEEFR